MGKYKGVQLILFGSPGVGKSYKVDNDYSKKLAIKPENKFRTTFHPEYKYGDFVGRLIPISDSNGKVKYEFQEGPLIKALAKAISNLIKYYTQQQNQGKGQGQQQQNQGQGQGQQKNQGQGQGQNQCQQQGPENVLLIIEELNRGNASAIFGDMFQLLDRDEDGWSSYELNINDLLAEKLIDLVVKDFEKRKQQGEPPGEDEIKDEIKKVNDFLEKLFKDYKLKFPPNFHIIATINTSDESIYFLDSAFKRRWNWEYIHVNDDEPWKKIKIWNMENEENIENVFITEELWEELRKSINNFIKNHADKIRNIEDKQIGKYFLKSKKVKCCRIETNQEQKIKEVKCYDKKVISFKDLQDKLAFFLWDSVFNRNKNPLQELVQSKIVTYADFIKEFPNFITKLLSNIKEELCYKIKLDWNKIVEKYYNPYKNKYFYALKIKKNIDVQKIAELIKSVLKYTEQNIEIKYTEQNIKTNKILYIFEINCNNSKCIFSFYYDEIYSNQIFGYDNENDNITTNIPDKNHDFYIVLSPSNVLNVFNNLKSLQKAKKIFSAYFDKTNNEEEKKAEAEETMQNWIECLNQVEFTVSEELKNYFKDYILNNENQNK